MSIKYYKIKTIILISLTIVVINIGLSYFNETINTHLNTITSTNFERIVSEKRNSFLNEINRNIKDVESISSLLTQFSENDLFIKEYIYSLKNAFNYENILLSNTNGFALELNGKSDEIINIYNKNYFQATLNGEVVISEPYISQISSNKVIAITSPVFIENEITDIIVVEYNVNYLVELLKINYYENSRTFILDNNLNILFSTDPNYTEKFPIDYLHFNTEQSKDSIAENMRNETNSIMEYSFNNEDRLALQMPLNFNGWTIFFALPKEIVTGEADILSETMIYVSSAIGIVFVGFVIFLSFYDQKNINKIKKIAFFDELTGIRNLTKFKIDIMEVLKNNKNKRYYLVKGDIVNFKAVNELYDYEIGNQVLIAVAETGKNIKDPSFIQARIGSDEFIMFAEEHFFIDMSKITKEYENTFKEQLDFAENHQFRFRLGRYLIEKNREDINEIDINEMINKVNLTHAFAKTKSNLHYCDYDEKFKEQIIKITDITNKMKQALDNKEFKVFLQSKNNIHTNEIVGAEALVRWIKDDGSMVFPNDFIPVFENNGFITELDKYMLDNVCSILKKWLNTNETCIPISVNFSRANINNPYFVEQIKSIVDKWQIPTKYIEVELTETATQDEHLEFENLFDNLKSSGFKISIDDFGSGYSSLGMLKNLNIDIVKLDRSFFLEHNKGDRGNVVIEEIVNLSHRLNMFVVAEGVETQEQVNFLKEINCNCAQGYFYAKPLPWEEFEKTIFLQPNNK